jgi:hypothetical protein
MENGMNPFVGLLRSRKFWLLILDVVISTIAFFVGRFTNEQVQEMVNFLIVTWQPVFVTIIAAVAWEDAAAKRSGNFYK